MTKMLTPAEAAERLGIKESTCKTWMRSGKLPGARRIGPGQGLLRISEDDLDAYLDAAPLVAPPEKTKG